MKYLVGFKQEKLLYRFRKKGVSLNLIVFLDQGRHK